MTNSQSEWMCYECKVGEGYPERMAEHERMQGLNLIRNQTEMLFDEYESDFNKAFDREWNKLLEKKMYFICTNPRRTMLLFNIGE